ncbi:type I restriction enzyme HsdR N-terminal domain-containing protein [Aeromonas salmonicida]|nr:type I restriction enzyme HsdR N-terminal domain-containing protein [Aeromonas salmonicida]EKP0266246.1 type I restriction enzyme HsdR N-terminal domain-containing protein [Aeromonas salmonicida]EKP0270566.1 type I restriction enzyme HsdR N-terminal domain-containing protein [Aeromonas salmonicida]EKP0288160.1 type I restriction enzyme HsdR N-terminal domain-containing protein [Aeromonas salmonicida]EKP0292485.1 type I restriction enzyme HsdR N-terminal domain-containing protein [Aeromonas s
MDFSEQLQSLAKKIAQQSSMITTEEATKNAFVMPFLNRVLGYDVFDPTEVIPEFTADTGIKKGEKVDYAILKDGQIQILVECKKYSEKLSTKHSGQLFRYFSVTNARIGILTNGAQYEFYTDLDAPNKMDEKPFLTLDLEDIDEHIVPEVLKLTKTSFDVESVVDAAGELKYLSQIKRLLAEQFGSPEEDFVKFFASRIYDGVLTARVKQSFTDITKKALSQFLNDSINARLKLAIGSTVSSSAIQPAFDSGLSSDNNEVDNSEEKSKVDTTIEEMEGFNVVKAILRQQFDVTRIAARDTQSYFGILLDDNNRKPLCRLHFNAKQKYIGLFDADKKETRHPISSIDEIFTFADQLLTATAVYE